jgi:hypothetical protein
MSARRKWSALLFGSLVAVIAAVLAASLIGSPQHNALAATGSGDASSAAWANQGQFLTNLKATTPPYPGDATNVDATSEAYQSVPVDITRNGLYTFRWSVPSSFSLTPTAAQPAHGISLEYPPDSDDYFQIVPGGPTTLSPNASGGQTLGIPLSVSDFQSAYLNYSVWVY